MEGECQQSADDDVSGTDGDHTHFGEAAAQELDNALADAHGMDDSSAYYTDELDKEFVTNVVSASVSQQMPPSGFR